jgi:hypothetical protein
MMFSQTNQSFAFRLSIAKYVNFDNQCPFSFEMNSNAVIKGRKLWLYHFLSKIESNDLPTYKPVNRDINVLLRDAQN